MPKLQNHGAKVILLVIFLLAFTAGGAILYSQRRIKSTPEAESSTEEVGLDFNALGTTPGASPPSQLSDVLSTKQLALPADPAQAGVKVVSGNIIPIQEEKPASAAGEQQNPNAQAKVGGLRIVGEMSNLSSRKIKNVQVLLRLFDEKEELVATKVGTWNPRTSFIPLSIGETGVYDVVVPGKPPQFAQASVEIRAADPPENYPNFVSSAVLKLENQNLEEKQAQGQGQTVKYHAFTAKLVNTSQQEIVNPGVLVWLKNSDNRVYALAGQSFNADLLAPGQKLDVEINLIPFSQGELVDYGVRVFGEEF